MKSAGSWWPSTMFRPILRSMSEHRVTALIALCLCLSACSGNDTPTTPAPPATPTPSTPVTYSLGGTVTEQSGNGIASALVQIMDGPDVNKAVVTDRTGAFTLGGLQSGEFTVNITAAGYTSLTQKVTLRADARLSFALQVGRRVISGTITDATSHGVLPNILVAVSSGPNAGQSTRTDATGSFALAGISNEITLLQASATSYLPSNRAVPAGGDIH